jgi:hypothetical protein
VIAVVVCERMASVPERLTFTRYTDLVLARLYEAENRVGPNQMVDVRELMSDLGSVVPSDWAWDAAKYIVDHGLGHNFLTMGSATTALTPDGRVFVEAERGTGIIGEYRSANQIAVVTGDGNQVAIGHGQQVVQTLTGDFSKEEVVELLDEAEARLASDNRLDEDARADALTDLRALRGQAEKKNPSREALRALAAGLAGVDSLADIVEKLHALF